LAIAGQAVALAGGQLAAGVAGNAVGDVNVKEPVASGPVIAERGTAAAHPATASGFREIGWPHAEGVVPLPQFV
jgi:hypothetical protein